MLEKAIAHVECKVVSRMETPDHWITYCEATEGNVANADKKTAVHRRKVSAGRPVSCILSADARQYHCVVLARWRNRRVVYTSAALLRTSFS